MGCGQSSTAPEDVATPRQERRSSVLPPPPEIPLTIGTNAKFLPPPNTKAFVVIGGPGSGKGRLVANICSMFGVRLLSLEGIILKYLPKKMAHMTELNGVDAVAELVKKDPSQVSLEWVLRLLQHYIESDPDQVFVVDLVPSLRWLLRDEHLIKDCQEELRAFEERCPLSFCIHFSLAEESLGKTLDYSHHNAPPPAGASVGDEADNGRAKRRFLMHDKASRPFLEYFHSSDRMISIDVSSGAEEAIWDKTHELLTDLQLHAWRPVDSTLVFAMDGMKVGNLDLSTVDMCVITVKDITTEPDGPIEGLLECLSTHIDTLAEKASHFVVDPTGTSILKLDMGSFNKHSIVFSDIQDKTEGCVNAYSKRLNHLAGGGKAYFKAVCSSDDETLIFPSSTPDNFCRQMALCMAEKHPSKITPSS